MMRRTLFLVLGAAAAVYASALPPGTAAVDAGRYRAAAADALVPTAPEPSRAYIEARRRVERDPELRAALRSGNLALRRERLESALQGSGLSAEDFLSLAGR
jgi:hypothetical protein